MSARAAGYSGTPLPKKLGIKAGARVAWRNQPEGWEEILGGLPDGVDVRGRIRGPLDLIVFFTTSRAELERGMPGLRDALDPAGSLWISWPKRASQVETDVTEDVVREIALANRLVDVKVAAVDETWSGLKLVIRVKDRPA